MLESFATQATVARIHAMYGKMLTRQNYIDLLSKQTVSEIAAYLKKNTRYHDILASIDINNIHRGLLEDLIRKNNFYTYEKLCKFQNLDKIPFYKYQIKKEEVNQILSCILHINAGKSEDYITTLPSYLIKRSSFNMIELAKSKTFADLLKVIKGTKYYNVIKQIRADENGQINYLRCEVLLRTEYYKLLLEEIDKDFKGKVALKLTENVKAQIDLTNFINAYRLKAYFHADAGAIKQNMLPFYGRINKTQMFRIYEAKNKDEMLELFEKSIYAKKITTINPEIVEKNISQIRYKSSKGSLQNANFAPVALYSFMNLCDNEAHNLINIIEGIRYNVPPTIIEKLLII